MASFFGEAESDDDFASEEEFHEVEKKIVELAEQDIEGAFKLYLRDYLPMHDVREPFTSQPVYNTEEYWQYKAALMHFEKWMQQYLQKAKTLQTGSFIPLGPDLHLNPGALKGGYLYAGPAIGGPPKLVARATLQQRFERFALDQASKLMSRCHLEVDEINLVCKSHDNSHSGEFYLRCSITLPKGDMLTAATMKLSLAEPSIISVGNRPLPDASMADACSKSALCQVTAEQHGSREAEYKISALGPGDVNAIVMLELSLNPMSIDFSGVLLFKGEIEKKYVWRQAQGISCWVGVLHTNKNSPLGRLQRSTSLSTTLNMHHS